MKKVLIIIAIVLAILGSVCFVGALAAADFDFSRIGTAKYVNNTHEITEDFDNIFVDLDTEDITFALSTDGKCRVECVDRENRPVRVSVNDGALRIMSDPQDKWYDHISFVFVSREAVTVYLPTAEYNALNIDVDTSDVKVSGELTFKTAEIEGDTGDVRFDASVSDRAEISTDTGDISVSNTAIAKASIDTDTGDVYVKHLTSTSLDISVDTGDITATGLNVTANIGLETNTGDIKLRDVNCDNLFIESDTGETELNNVISIGQFNINSDTGDVEFNGCDAAEITVRTTTGDVSGTLRREMVFITKSSTGDIDVPKSTNGGKCEITTSTGDIEIEIVYGTDIEPK